jgi:hypothetical protein
MRFTTQLLGAALLAAAAATHAASLIDVQFSNDASHAQSGAAVVGHSGDTWNNFTSGHAGSGSLVDVGGGASGVSLSFAASNFWESDPSYFQFAGKADANLMQGYLVGYAGQPDIALSFTGLVAGHQYGFWVYTQGDDNSRGRSISLSADGGPAAIATQTNTDGFVLGDNYVYLTAVADGAGDVTLLGHDLDGEANIDGVQLMAVPEPSELVLLMAGAMFIAGLVVRRNRAR